MSARKRAKQRRKLERRLAVAYALYGLESDAFQKAYRALVWLGIAEYLREHETAGTV